jgi:hypothetical protein
MRAVVAPLLLALLTLPAALPLVGAQVGTASAPAWGPTNSPIRPGAPAETTEGYCTFNFLFYDNSNAYIGTAAHCTDKVGDRVVRTGLGEIGTVVYDSDKAAGANRDVDFTLVRLDANRVAQANPLMYGFNAPTGSAPRTELRIGEPLGVYGYGLVFGDVPATRARQGVLVSTTSTLYRADLPAVNGDSGAPLIEIETGRAVGIISHYGFTAGTTDEGPLMSFIFSELQKANFNVQLATV